jgi:hypothetical protein
LLFDSWQALESRSIRIRDGFADSKKEKKMKKAACAVFILTLSLFLVNPLPSEARGGHGGGGGWWVPWAIVGGAAVVAHHYYYAPHYSPYYAPQPVVIQERPPVYIQPAPSISPTAERIFIYPRRGQSEELQVKDRYECHLWAVSQTGYDPTQPAGGMPDQATQQRADYQRAQGACLDAREYTVK